MKLIRGSILHFLSDPKDAAEQDAYQYFSDGGLLIEHGKVLCCDTWQNAMTKVEAMADVANVEVEHIDYSGYLITPGFVDTHIHYAQTDVLASPGHGLLDWLERYTFPAERAFADPVWAESVAEFFCDELLSNGTTTALVFGTVHPQSVDVFFKVAQKRGLRMVAGKVMMDRNCPDYLSDTAQTGYDDSKRLIETWHGVDRLSYAITPRFAITSSEAQMESVSALAQAYPQLNIHSHLAENKAECAWVQELYPWSRSYLDVYDHYGLLRPGAVYAHCIYLDAYDQTRMAESGSSVAFSPTSNLFLGSGLFDLAPALKANVSVGIATDVGGGTSFSMLRTLAAAYQVAHLNGYVLSSLRAFYLATLAGAKALGLSDVIGNFAVGKEADFIVLDPEATPLIARRMASCQNLEEQLFVWMTLGEDRAIAATYIMGNMQCNKL
jgi:guanine deaminase